MPIALAVEVGEDAVPISQHPSIPAVGRVLRRHFGQRSLADRWHRTLTSRYRAFRRLSPGGKRVKQRLGRGTVDILVEIVIDLEDRRVDASAKAFDLDQCELTVGSGFA